METILNTVITTARRTSLCEITSGKITKLAPIKYMVFGTGGTDSAGVVIDPDPDAAELKEEAARYEISKVEYPEPTTAKYTAVIPEGEHGGVAFTEVALADENGVLCAVRNMLPKTKDSDAAFRFELDDIF